METKAFPVETINWDEAVEFCRKLSEQEKLTGSLPHRGGFPGESVSQPYALPTEAEWEFACRAGTTTAFWTGDDPAEVARAAWCLIKGEDRAYPVAQLEANPFGLFDVHGGVWEWVRDGWNQNYFEQLKDQSVTDPQGLTPQGSQRVLRGGAFGLHPWHCRSSNRGAVIGRTRSYGWGFRVALSVQAVKSHLQKMENPPSLQFDGSGARVEIPSLTLDATKPITIEVLTRPSTPVVKGIVPGIAGQCGLRLRGRHWWFGVQDKDSTIHEVTASSDAAWKKLTHVAGVFDGSHVRLFVNGIRHGDPVPCANMAPINGIVTLGAAVDGTDSYAGSLSLMRFSQVARYTDDFDPPTAFTADDDTLALYRFEDGQGTQLSDLSSHQHHGKIIHAKWLPDRVQEVPKVGTVSGAATPDRLAAEWVIGLGGIVQVQGSSNQISDLKSLPALGLKLTHVQLTNKPLLGENREIVPLGGLEQVEFVGLDGAYVSLA